MEMQIFMDEKQVVKFAWPYMEIRPNGEGLSSLQCLFLVPLAN